jgi:adenylate cyclase class 2
MEIEKKIKISNSKTIKDFLSSLGADNVGRIEMNDYYYFLPGCLLYTEKKHFRIRRYPDRLVCGLYEAVDDYAAEEKEIDISPDQFSSLEGLLFFLGYRKVPPVVAKLRDRFRLDGINIVFDTLPEIGEFMEVEIISNNLSQGKKKIDGLLARLNLSDKKCERLRYPEMYWEKMGILGRPFNPSSN